MLLFVTRNNLFICRYLDSECFCWLRWCRLYLIWRNLAKDSYQRDTACDKRSLKWMLTALKWNRQMETHLPQSHKALIKSQQVWWLHRKGKSWVFKGGRVLCNMWLHRHLGRVSPFPSGKAQRDEEPYVVEISPLATLLRNSKGESSDFICAANMLSNSKTPSQSPSHRARLAQESPAGLGTKRFAAGPVTSSSSLFRLVTWLWAGRKLCARHPRLLLPSEHKAFMVSKQILDGSFHICGPEAELRKNSLSHEQCLEAKKKEKTTKKSRVLPTLKTKYSA